MTEPLLRVDGLHAQLLTGAGLVKAVDDVSFTLEHGEVLGLVGESGSGKSTTGYAITGLLEPPGRIVGGRIVFAGRDLTTLSAEAMRQLRGHRIAMIFADPRRALNPVLRTETQLIETVLAHARVSRAAARTRVREVLIDVGIPLPEARLRDYPHQFSAGMRQRVAMAIALLNRPDLIIADEPTAALEVTTQGQILYQLQALIRESGAALIYITRDLALVAGLADRVAIMYAGRIVEQGYTADVLRVPGHPYTRALLDSLPASGSPGEKLRQIPGTMPALNDLPSGCAFRPRCAYATAECAQTPPLRPHGAVGQSLRCFHPLPPPA